MIEVIQINRSDQKRPENIRAHAFTLVLWLLEEKIYLKCLINCPNKYIGRSDHEFIQNTGNFDTGTIEYESAD